jgi:hypothetical protein
MGLYKYKKIFGLEIRPQSDFFAFRALLLGYLFGCSSLLHIVMTVWSSPNIKKRTKQLAEGRRALKAGKSLCGLISRPTFNLRFFKPNLATRYCNENPGIVSLTLSYSSKINNYFYHQRVSPLMKKNTLICFHRAMLPIQSGVTALCR